MPENLATAGAKDRGAVARLDNGGGRAPLLLVCEHASNRIPAEFGGLGLDAEVRSSHVAWDPGALAVAEALSRRLDAPLVYSTVSRLVYDCNRPPDAPDAMPARSEVFDIPGNAGLDTAERARRTRLYYEPFRKLLAETLAQGRRAMVTVHSFTPVYMGRRRDVELGVLHDSDSRLADAILELAPRFCPLEARRNAPYGPRDGVTHSLREHALPAGIPNVMLEIRNDLIASPQAQQQVAASLAPLITAALAGLDRSFSQEARR